MYVNSQHGSDLVMAARRIPPFKLEDPRSYVVDLQREGNWLLYCTTRLEVDDGQGFGTGFFYVTGRSTARKDYLVTNKHVIAGANVLRITLHSQAPRERRYFRPAGRLEVVIPDPESRFVMHPDQDLCAIPVERIRELVKESPDQIFYSPLGEHMIMTDDDYRRLFSVMRVAMIGYPIGLWDHTHNLPVIRTGHTASHPAVSFEREPISLVDIAVFPGSSGSPVMLWERSYWGSVPKMLGVLFAGHHFDKTAGFVRIPVPTSTAGNSQGHWINLGCIVRAPELRWLAPAQPTK